MAGIFSACWRGRGVLAGVSNARAYLARTVVESLFAEWLFFTIAPMRFPVSTPCVRIARLAMAVAAMARAMRRDVALKPAAPAPHP